MAQRIKFYFDEMMRRAVTSELIKRGYDVVMAVDVAMTQKTDPEHLQHATSEERVVVTRDKPFACLTMSKTDHAGLICWTGSDDDIGSMISRLAEFAEQYTPEQAAGQVFWLK